MLTARFDARRVWYQMSGSPGELQRMCELLDDWSDSLAPKGKGRQVWLLAGSDLMVLGGALLANMEEWKLVGTAGESQFGDPEDRVVQVAKLVEAGLLRDYQRDAILASLGAEMGRGIIDAAMGAGKTRIAAGVISVAAAAGYGRWLYLVQNKELAAQSMKSFDSLIPEMLKVLDSSSSGVEGISTTYSGVSKLTNLEFDGVLVDECHALPPRTRSLPYSEVQASWRIGLSGTPLDRQDDNALTVGLLGPIVYHASQALLAKEGYLSPGAVRVVRRGFSGQARVVEA